MYGPFELIHEDTARKGALYTIRFDDREESEFHRFLNNSSFQNEAHYNPLLSFLDDMLERFGFQERFFKHRGYPDALGYLKKMDSKSDDYPTLRLYVIRWSESLLIVGSGCIKRGGGPLANYPGCSDAFNRLEYANRCIELGRKDGDMWVDPMHSQFCGTLHFEGQV